MGLKKLKALVYLLIRNPWLDWELIELFKLDKARKEEITDLIKCLKNFSGIIQGHKEHIKFFVKIPCNYKDKDNNYIFATYI